MSLGLSPRCQQVSRCLRTPGSLPGLAENTQREGPVWAKRMSAYNRLWEVKCKVPGTTRGRDCTKSAINEAQASGYVRARGSPRYRSQIPAEPNPHSRTSTGPEGRMYSTGATNSQTLCTPIIWSPLYEDTVQPILPSRQCEARAAVERASNFGFVLCMLEMEDMTETPRSWRQQMSCSWLSKHLLRCISVQV